MSTLKKQFTYLSALLIVITVLFITGCSTNKNSDHPFNSQSITKSQLDKNQYRAMTLKNGLRVVLISNPNADQAAAALAVNAGSYNDPKAHLGLAHFLEHMLFLGTKEFPKPSAFFQYVQSNGGMANAYTDNTNTTYLFSINKNQLQPALARWSTFFINPLFTPEYTDRERNAVNSEFEMYKAEDSRRIYEINKATSNPNSPFHHFSVGNLNTLKNNQSGDLQKALQSFFKKFYIANNMTLAIYGSQSLDTMQSWVNQYFEAIPKGQPNIATDLPIYTKKQLGLAIHYRPLKNIKKLTLTFPISQNKEDLSYKPLDYIIQLINSKHKNGLINNLKQSGYIYNFNASLLESPIQSRNALDITFNLTDKGLKHQQTIIKRFFAYIHLIAQQGVTEKRYSTLARLSEMQFKYNVDQNNQPLDLVTGIADKMQYIPTQQLLTIDNLYLGYKPQLIKKYLHFIQPNNMRILLAKPNISTNLTEPYFGGQYKIVPIDAKKIKEYETATASESNLSLPPLNEFIPNDFTLITAKKIANDNTLPEKFIHQPGLSGWLLTDTSFKTPKVNVYIMISSPNSSNSAIQTNTLDLYIQLLKRKLADTLTQANQAGLNTSIIRDNTGITININGFSDKAKKLASRILEALKKPIVDQQAFNELKTELAVQIHNQLLERPYLRAIKNLYKAMYPNIYNEQTRISALKNLSLKSLNENLIKFYKAVHVNVLITGNYDMNQAKELSKLIQSTLLNNKQASQRYFEPFISLQNKKEKISFKPGTKEASNVYLKYIQSNQTDLKTIAKYELLQLILKSDFFEQLRTQQQLGYVVTVINLVNDLHPGIGFLVQSPHYKTNIINERVHQFLKAQYEKINHMNLKTFNDYKNSLIETTSQKDKSSLERAQRYFNYLYNNQTFDVRQKYLTAIHAINLKSIQDTMKIVLGNKNFIIITSDQ